PNYQEISNYLYNLFENSCIKALLSHPSKEMVMMIEEFNPVLLTGDDMYEIWLEKCFEFAEENGVPLAEWIENKPAFSFSAE
ncbi:MAG: hypothetical protein ACI3ZP_05030, partial [Candidatus Cryptobacteroides sp.]